MSAVPTLLVTRDRLARELEAIETQRTAWFRTGKFSLTQLAQTQAIIASLPNLRDESLAALAKHGKAKALPEGEPLTLTGIGWLDTKLGDLSEVQCIGAVEQALKRLADTKDADLLAAAVTVAKSLRNDRDEWTARLAPIATWASKHEEEIREEETA